jgi:hypothetical protein
MIVCGLVWLYWARRLPFLSLGGFVVFVVAGGYLAWSVFQALLHRHSSLSGPVTSLVHKAVSQYRQYREPNTTVQTRPGPSLDADRDTEDGEDLVGASRNWWFVKTGQRPPAASYEVIGRRMRLGRLVDPYTAQAEMEKVRRGWQGAWWWLMILLGTVLAVWGLNPVALALVAVVWFSVRARYTRTYNTYLKAQRKILATEQPQWIAYERKPQLLRTESGVQL